MIDDTFSIVTTDASGTVTVPATAVAFSLVPITGRLPVEVVLDDKDKNALIVDSPRYLEDGRPFKKLKILGAPPHTTYRLRLLVEPSARDLGRTLHSGAGNLVTERPGAIKLFDIDTSTTRGIVAWRELAAMVLEQGAGVEQYFRVAPTAPMGFQRIEMPPPPPHPYYEEVLPAEPTWNVSASSQVVFGVEMWGNATDDSGEREHQPAFGLFVPVLSLVDVDAGADSNDPLFMGAVGDFAPSPGEVIPYYGKCGRIFTGAAVDSQSGLVTRTTQRAIFARFELKLKGGDMSLSDFTYQRRFLRLFAYAVVV